MSSNYQHLVPSETVTKNNITGIWSLNFPPETYNNDNDITNHATAAIGVLKGLLKMRSICAVLEENIVFVQATVCMLQLTSLLTVVRCFALYSI